MKKAWRRVLQVIGVALILIGLFQLAAPSISNWLIEHNIIKQEEVYDGLSADDLAKNKKTKAEFDFGTVTAINPSETLLDPKNIDPNLIIGKLYIPSISVNLTLFKGLDNSILNAGVGTMRPDQEMGKGNYPIAGHWMGRDDLLLSALKHMREGDKIYITDKDKIYEYEMYEMKVVHETEIGWIEDQVAEEHGSPIISLMNCVYEKNKGFGFSDTGNRRFVFGELKDIRDYDASEFEKKAKKPKKKPQKKEGAVSNHPAQTFSDAA
ncbi:class A sortase [Allofustis seminis]|uniref:class A sortase n=1 Tax=Allofustis seminis TaxID=166939 RepID=UPI00036DF365|nr:class A sortase [Allofustis seminis]